MNEEFKKVRLDQFVSNKLAISRKASNDLIKDGKVKINKVLSTKPSSKVDSYDKISISQRAKTSAEIEDIELPIIYEDDNVVVINKPIGILTHSKGAFNPEPTVASWLEHRVPSMKGDNRAGIVHRLDRATSGIMILAKNPETLAFLQKQFSQRRTKKCYTAIVEDEINPSEAVIDMPIERNPKRPQTFRVGVNGKPATTHYKTLELQNGLSLLELKPVTGRTHQLRVHLKHQGHPIVGDTLYGGKVANRLYLHAQSLEITLPGGERKTFSAEIPSAFEGYLNA
ncbi:MAG TPA: RluA family pseudouridine synthase [Candidatus Saccharimonadales bacterium]|nr:RluA family pseudouridine synthase [Candidatus Saccharimonadales bacterium]